LVVLNDLITEFRATFDLSLDDTYLPFIGKQGGEFKVQVSEMKKEEEPKPEA